MATRAEFWFSGLPVSPGIAMGTVFRSDSGALPVPERSLEPEEIEGECRRLTDATEKSIRQIRKLKSKTGGLESAAAEELGFLLDARLQMLSGSRLVRGSEKRIRDRQINAEAAVRDEIATITEAFAKMSDRYLAARGADVSEVGERLIRNLLRQPFHSLKDTPSGSVIVAEELTPADTALLDPERVVAFMTALGGAESHTAIIARSLGIPAILGIAGLLNAVRDGETVIVDGNDGRVVINPSDETVADYTRRIVALSAERRSLLRLRKVASVTRDGTRIALECNLEMPRDVPAALINGAVGIGLLRTEFMFMNRDTIPSEEEQYSLLRQVVESMNGRPVTIRTLDIGGDKLAPSLREQLGEAAADGANPALGLRGIRLSLEHPRLFEGQLAAILRAAAYGPVRILLPMITSASEIERVRGVLDRVMRRLRRRKDPIPTDMPPLGAMIEVPGAALAADGLSMVADFFAIGTNDLTMYALAIDRGDDRVAPLYNPLHPSVLRLIQFTLEAGMRSRIPVSICGEIAGDPRYTALLLGLGVRDLSMAVPKIPRVKQRILQLDLATATRRARMVMDQPNEERIKELVEEFNLSMALAEGH